MANPTSSLPIVSLVGHSPENLERLYNLYLENYPEQPHRPNILFNGESDKWLIGGKKVPNDLLGRDIEMHYRTIQWFRSYWGPNSWGVFLNDDIVHIADNKWLAEAAEAMENYSLYGFQPNLGSMVDPTYAKRGEVWNISNRPLFIRTHAFACRLDWFERCWKQAEGDAQKFEKQNLGIPRGPTTTEAWEYTKTCSPWALAKDYTQIMDSNTYPHRQEIRRWQKQTAQR